jgi:general secretion pathway protein K
MSVDIDRIGSFRLNGTPVSCAVANKVATISVNAAAGLIDINSASNDVLEALFAHAGADNAKSLAAAVIDFRDADDETSPDGAEASEYQAAGLAYGPKNGPFLTVGELDQVVGVTSELLARVRPLVTTHSNLAAPDITVASADVLGLSLPAQLSNRSNARSLRIRVSVRSGSNSNVGFTREAAILLEPRVRGGYLLKEWRNSEQLIEGSGNVGSDELQSCVYSVLAVGN